MGWYCHPSPLRGGGSTWQVSMLQSYSQSWETNLISPSARCQAWPD